MLQFKMYRVDTFYHLLTSSIVRGWDSWHFVTHYWNTSTLPIIICHLKGNHFLYYQLLHDPHVLLSRVQPQCACSLMGISSALFPPHWSVTWMLPRALSIMLELPTDPHHSNIRISHMVHSNGHKKDFEQNISYPLPTQSISQE